jgi:hypothetical protein
MVDFLAKEVVALQNFFDFIQIHFNKHCCNLRGPFAVKMLHEFIDCAFDLLFVVLILFGNVFDDCLSFFEVNFLKASFFCF